MQTQLVRCVDALVSVCGESCVSSCGLPLFTVVITVLALGAIAVITAWETQMLKRIYYGSAGNEVMMRKLSAFGAASLLLSFINLFQILMSLFGRE